MFSALQYQLKPKLLHEFVMQIISQPQNQPAFSKRTQHILEYIPSSGNYSI